MKFGSQYLEPRRAPKKRGPLSPAQVKVICARLARGGENIQAIADEFGVKKDTIKHLVNRVKELRNTQRYEDGPLATDTPTLRVRDPIEAAIERLVLGPLREECALALHGLSKNVGVVVDRTEQQLLEMTQCESFPDGLDFSTDSGPGRYALYRLREDIQRVYGLYFIGAHNAGVKFTIHPLVGMQWRENEFDDKARGAAQQLSRMWRLALSSLGDSAPSRTDVIQPAADDRCLMLDRASAIVQSGIIVDLSITTPPHRRRKRA